MKDTENLYFKNHFNLYTEFLFLNITENCTRKIYNYSRKIKILDNYIIIYYNKGRKKENNTNNTNNTPKGSGQNERTNRK